jgi:N-acetyl-gamma-glutamyl-phosphate reductase
MIKAGIIGGAGYTGGETIRLLALHPDAELSWVQSESQAGKHIYEVHNDCYGITDLRFTKHIENADVIFLCKGHGESRSILEKEKISASTKVIDLSQDFRHLENSESGNRKFVYGLPELNRKKISSSANISNPGCFATAVQLALLPLAEQGLLNSDIHISATTGSTGAGQSLSSSNHFPWRSNNHSAYKILDHQHEKEITESLQALQPSFKDQLVFVPQRGAFTRGIYSVTHVEGEFDQKKIASAFGDYYASHPFTHFVPFEIDVKQIVNTNNCFVNLQFRKSRLVIISAIDNMLKGAAGQAIQNMNLMFGIEETRGLKLKPSAF